MRLSRFVASHRLAAPIVATLAVATLSSCAPHRVNREAILRPDVYAEPLSADAIEAHLRDMEETQGWRFMVGQELVQWKPKFGFFNYKPSHEIPLTIGGFTYLTWRLTFLVPPLPQPETGGAGYLTFSMAADGRTIAFISIVWKEKGPVELALSVWNAASESPRLVRPLPPDTPWGVYRPIALSPDGTRLAFIILDQDRDVGNLIVRDLARGEERTVDAGAAGDVHWTPDGKALVYLGRVSKKQRVAHDLREIVRLDLETGERTVIAEGLRPSLSPDGRRVAFSTQRGKTLIETLLLQSPSPIRPVVRDLETGAQTALLAPRPWTEGRFTPDWPLLWSPDGRFLNFVALSDFDVPMSIVVDTHSGGRLRLAKKHGFQAWARIDPALEARCACADNAGGYPDANALWKGLIDGNETAAGSAVGE